MLAPWKKSYDHPRQHIKKQRHCSADKVPSSQSYGFSSSHVWMWELDYKDSWALKNWCFWTVVLEKPLESPLDCKEIQPVSLKGNLSWIFFGRTGTEAETPILWLPDVKNWLIGKDPDAGKDWKQEEKGTTEDEVVGWHHWLYGHEFEWTSRIGDGQGGLACCSPCGCKELDTTEWLNRTDPNRSLGSNTLHGHCHEPCGDTMGCLPTTCENSACILSECCQNISDVFRSYQGNIFLSSPMFPVPASQYVVDNLELPSFKLPVLWVSTSELADKWLSIQQLPFLWFQESQESSRKHQFFVT